MTLRALRGTAAVDREALLPALPDSAGLLRRDIPGATGECARLRARSLAEGDNCGGGRLRRHAPFTDGSDLSDRSTADRGVPRRRVAPGGPPDSSTKCRRCSGGRHRAALLMSASNSLQPGAGTILGSVLHYGRHSAPEQPPKIDARVAEQSVRPLGSVSRLRACTHPERLPDGQSPTSSRWARRREPTLVLDPKGTCRLRLRLQIVWM